MQDTVEFTGNLRRAWTWLVALALLALLLPGCGGDEPERMEGVGPAPANVIYPASDYFEQAPGRRGGTLRVSVALDTGSLDLHALSHTTPSGWAD